MGRMGYLSQRDEAENARFYFETHAEAGFHNLIGMKVLDGGSTEGCIQRQLILLNEGLLIRDPMEYFEEITRHRMIRGQFPFDKVYSLPKLNALLAAFTAWLACNQPERIQRMGDMEEGELLLPGKKNK